MGEEAVSVTEYEYDDDGRLVRSVTTHSPRFTPDDYWAMVDRRRSKAAECPGCGYDRAEVWITPDKSDDDVRALDRRFRAELIECARCAKADRKRGVDPQRAGRHTIVRDR